MWRVWSVQRWILNTAPRVKEKKDLLFNSTRSQGLSITHCAQFFQSCWREIDHMPELILNHSIPHALSWGLCPLLSRHGTKEDGRVWGKEHHRANCVSLDYQREQRRVAACLNKYMLLSPSWLAVNTTHIYSICYIQPQRLGSAQLATFASELHFIH